MGFSTTLTVNSVTRTVQLDDPRVTLLDLLREHLDLTGTKKGCDRGQCGACTVLVDNRAVRSCQLAVSSVVGKEIVTLEGLETAGKPHPVQAAFIAEQTFQCGYCLNGWVMTTKALLDKNPSPSDAEMRNAFESLVCRCGSHVGIFAAVRRASQSPKRSA